MYKTAFKIGNVLTVQLEEENFVTFFNKCEILAVAASKSSGRNVAPFYREVKSTGGFYFGFCDLDTGEELTFHVRKENKGYYLTGEDQYRRWQGNPNDQGEADTAPQDGPPDDGGGSPPSDFDPVPQPARRPAAPAARPAQAQQRQGPPRPPATRTATSGGGQGW